LQAKNEQKFMLFLDYDGAPHLNRNWYTYTYKNHIWERNLEMVTIEAQRLMRLCPKLGGKALILKSSPTGSYHVIFPDAQLTWNEVEALLAEAKCHKGYKHFSLLIGDQTLRISAKPKTHIHPPYLVKIVEAKNNV